MVTPADAIPSWWNSKNAYHLLPVTTERNPATTNVASRIGAPQLILLCTWTDAAPKNIQKYIAGYQLLYPSSPILLIRTSSADFFTPEKILMQKAGVPSCIISQALKDTENPTQPTGGLLAHALSNGGSSHLAILARRYHEDTCLPLPVDAIILDSTPTKPTFTSLMASLSMPLPRLVLVRQTMKAAIAMAVFLVYLVPRWLGMIILADRTYHDLCSSDNESDDAREMAWLKKGAIRTYIYSDTDVLCRAKDIESHFRTAQSQGLRVRSEPWQGSGHVAHMKMDPERYWRVVRETWNNNN